VSMKAVPALVVSLAIASDAANLPPAAIPQNPLTTIAAGQDEAFGAMVAPAQSLESGHSREERVRAVIDRISGEMDAVRMAFATALPAERIGATKAAVARFSPETARDGAARSFEGKGPSLSLMRQLLFVPSASADLSVDVVMQAVSQFERSPKPEDNYYEYSEPADPAASMITSLSGSRETLTAQPRPPMTPDQVYALKKCRHVTVLGWFCNTALYQVREVGGGVERPQSLFTVLRPLPKGADNRMFEDERATNIVDGYTALYLVMRADNLVLVYSLGVQSKAGEATQQSMLNQGHKDEYRQLVRYIEAKLGTGKLPF